MHRVLHHLPDPDAGLSALRSVLKPDGAMQPTPVDAPTDVPAYDMLQEFCRRIGLHANDIDIRELIAALQSLPPGHALQNLLSQAPDFRNEAALADALPIPRIVPTQSPNCLISCRMRDWSSAAGSGRRPTRFTAESSHEFLLSTGLLVFPYRNSSPPSNCFAERCFAIA